MRKLLMVLRAAMNSLTLHKLRSFLTMLGVVIGVGAHVSDQVVYDLVKAVYGNKKSLIEGHPNFRAFQEKEAGKPQPNLPHHPGAIKFFKEAGIWKG